MQISLLVQYLREKIEPKLIYSPFLRLIIFNVWFQLGFAAVVLTIVAAALYLPKIWRVSPPEFEPIIHVSGLDLTQNWSLKRSARKLQESGNYVKAAEAWRSAVAENPADLEALHGFLENCNNLERPENRFVMAAYSQMPWLLRLNRTNAADVELVARVCDSFGAYDVAAYFLGQLRDVPFSPATEGVWIKTLFHQGRMGEFSKRIEKAGDLKDPELGYYRLAFTAGWESDPASAAAFSELERAAAERERSERVGHLLLRAAAQKNKVDTYSAELERLAGRNEANAGDHALYWALLASNGRTNEAVKLAESFTLSPGTSLELLRVAQSYSSLGLVDNAQELLKRLAPQFGRSPEVWITYATVLERKQDWDEMRAAGRAIRQDVNLRETMWGFGHFLEGRADLAQRRDATGEVAFERAAESTYENENVAFLVARELTRLEFPKPALKIFGQIEAKFEKSADFWNQVFVAAHAAKDTDTLLKAAERAYKLNATDPLIVNRYAAAMILKRVRPEEAIQLTLQLYARYPQSHTAMINHSCALLLNHRAEEARALLEKVDPKALNSLEISPYYLALFEAYHSLKMWDEAWKAREAIADGTLFANQREWLIEREKEMPNRAAEKA